MPDQHLSPDARAIIAALEHAERRRAENEQRMHAENTASIEQLRQEMRQIASGFPGEDPEGHRRYHESVIEWRELRNKMVRDALVQAAKVGGLGAIGWVAFALWQAIKMEVLR